MFVDLSSIDMGKNDAKLDSLDKYFYDCGYIKKIKQMNKFFIIGRKGSGKSAIAYYMKKNICKNLVTDIVSFREIPIQLMEQFYDERFSSSNKHTSLWTFILAVELSKLFLDSTKINASARTKVKTFLELINPSLKASPKDYLSTVVTLGWKIGCEYAEMNGSKQTSSENETNVISYTNSLIDLLVRETPLDENFHLFFDELDDNFQDTDAYKNIIISLFKATVDLNSKFLAQSKKMSVVILLRDDIYGKLVYADKNKWRDFGIFLDWTPRVELEWYQQKLFKIANERIGASVDGVVRADINYWNMIFPKGKITEKENAFDFIVSRTFFRPRDIIQYVKSAIETAEILDKKIIDKDVIFSTDRSFGEWFRDELIDELAPVIPNIREIFDVLKIFQKPSFFLNEIEPVFTKHSLEVKYSTCEIMKILYEYSIVGQFPQVDSNIPVFKYRNQSIVFDSKNKLCLHYGLRTVLGLASKTASLQQIKQTVKSVTVKDVKKNMPRGVHWKYHR